MNRGLPRWFIIWVSVSIPLVVFSLRTFPRIVLPSVFDHLPFFNACINGTTAVILLMALYAIKKNDRLTHQKLMITSLFLSLLFLISYVLYHISHPHTSYGGEGILRYLYYFFLATHILFSAFIVPMVLVTLHYALSKQYQKHRQWARITFPLWIYVAVTGVLVYIFISPYYPS